MSEYWKSTPKYWCKHCQTFVVDTPLGKKNHETSGKHQGALKRFLRDLHRSNERTQSERAAAKSEVARLNALVSGSSSSSSAAASTVAKPEQKKGERWGTSNKVLTEEERKRQMRELEALGVALPEQYRKEAAIPGEWTTVSTTVEKVESEKERVLREAREEAVKEQEELERKRKWEEMDEDERAMRGFKIATKTWPGESEDVDVSALFKKRKKLGSKEEESAEDVKKEEEETVRIKRESTEEMNENTHDGHPIKKEPRDSPSPSEHEVKLPAKEHGGEQAGIKQEDAEVKTEEGAGVIFKKRKAKNIRKKD